MMRHISGRVVLLVFAVAFVAGLLYVRSQPREVDDPVADAVKQMYESFGFEVSAEPGGTGGGVTVLRVKRSSPAEYLGIKVGDRFIAVNDRSVWHAKNLMEMIADSMNAGPTSLLVEKDGVYRQVIIGRRAAGGGGRVPSAAPQAPAGRAPGGRPAPGP